MLLNSVYGVLNVKIVIKKIKSVLLLSYYVISALGQDSKDIKLKFSFVKYCSNILSVREKLEFHGLNGFIVFPSSYLLSG